MAKRASSARNLSPNEQNMKENQEKEILDILQNNQYASIDALAQALFVSPSTIRRKLNALQQKGLITRTHGGAQINDEKNFFPSFTFRVHQNSFEKKKMALAAMKLIENGNLIFLDGTTSAFFIAEYLSEFKNLRVITNGVDTLSLLAKNHGRSSKDQHFPNSRERVTDTFLSYGDLLLRVILISHKSILL